MNYIHSVLSILPSIELSYEKQLDKKVQSDLCFALPYGKKYVFYFTIYNGNYTCFSVPIYRGKCCYDELKLEKCCFDKELCFGYGTVVLGVKLRQQPIVVLYDVFYYRNRAYFNNDPYSTKLALLLDLLNSGIKNMLLFSDQLSFRLPQFDITIEALGENHVDNIYAIYSYVFVNLSTTNTTTFMTYRADRHLSKEYTVFMIKPDKLNTFDIYNLYVYDNGSPVIYQQAHINKLSMSYELNALFYPSTSKYVANMDTIEESDDDETDVAENTFEDGRRLLGDKTTALVYCSFNPHIRLWQPETVLKTSDKRIKVATLREINHH